MLRLSRLTRRSTSLRLPPSSSHNVFIACRAPNTLFRRSYRVSRSNHIIPWTPPQQAFISQLLTVLDSRKVAEQVGQLPVDKARVFQELTQEISAHGQENNLSIGRLLAFLTENNIAITQSEEELDNEVIEDLAADVQQDDISGALDNVEAVSEQPDAQLTPDIVQSLKALLDQGQAEGDLSSYEKQQMVAMLSVEQEIQRLPQDERVEVAKELTHLLQQFQVEAQNEIDARDQALGRAAEANAQEPAVDDGDGPEYHYWPDLMRPDPLMDSRDVLDLPPTKEDPFHNRVIIRNHNSMFHEAHIAEHQTESEAVAEEQEEQEAMAFSDDSDEFVSITNATQDIGDVSEADEDDDLDNMFLEEDDDSEDQYELNPDDPRVVTIPQTETDLEDPTPELVLRSGISRDFKRTGLHIYTNSRFVKHQTGKGKIMQLQAFCLVGNGDGLVGFGKGSHPEHGPAAARALAQAFKNMDFVDRFENRTVWSELQGKFGSTKIIIRPRPLGFGLRCNPTLHRIFRAAGISDVSAKVWKSRTPLVVTQGALRMIQSGHNPLGKGDGAGGAGHRLEKGTGMRSAQAISLARGRLILPQRK